MFLFGVSYAVASIGCTMPTFLIAVAGTMDNQSVADGVVAFAMYAVGMALVLSTLTVTLALARTSVVEFLRWSQRYIDQVAGVLVALAGAYVAWYGLYELRTFESTGGDVPSSGIVGGVTGLSADISAWINDIGAVPLAVVLGLILGLAALWTTYLRASQPPRPAQPPPDAAADAQREDHEPPSDPQPSREEINQ
jgi:hypothetical protein